MNAGMPPGKNVVEITLFGPGYGESVVLHVGSGAWIVVDSCIDQKNTPVAIDYLNRLGVDPAEAVTLVVATHWHDDHIRGMARLVAACTNAKFCCAGVLCRKEFLEVAGALEAHPSSAAGSGLREIHGVFSHLAHSTPFLTPALANRRILVCGACEVWSFSPDDSLFQAFLKAVGALLPGTSQARIRAPSLSPNEVAVALWIQVGDVAVVLGSDLEKQGWTRILQSGERPSGLASAFKIPHHGAKNADEPNVWTRMLVSEAVAVLTPWRRGGRELPTPADVRRIRSCTPNAYATAKHYPTGRTRAGMVDRTLRELGVTLRGVPTSSGAIRLRRRLGADADWRVETFGTACRLDEFAA